MKKVLLAVGYKKLEEHLKKSLKPDCLVVGVTTYKEGVYKAVATKNPDILIFRETLPGSEDTLTLMYQIIDNYPDTRIIFLAGNREPGDKLLERLVSYNIYDITTGSVNVTKLIELVRNPNTRADVKHFQHPPNESGNSNAAPFIPTSTPQPKQEQEEEQEQEDTKVEEVKPEIEEPKAPNKPIVKELISHIPKPPTMPKIEPVVLNKDDVINSSEYEDEGKTENECSEPKEVDMKKDEAKKKGFGIMNPFQKTTIEEDGDRSEKKTISIPKFKKPVATTEEDDADDSEPKKKGLFANFPIPERKKSSVEENSGERIIAFVGGKPGVGTTTIAFSVAMELAQKGKKVIFLEADDINPSVSYWYQLFMMNSGLENTLQMLENKEFHEVEKTIIKMSELRKSDPTNYKKFPATLDFMFYSRRYLTRENLSERILPDFKELYLHLAYQLGYDYVIVDVNCNGNRKNKEAAIRYSNKVFSVVTQDISSMAYHVADFHNMESKGLKVEHKNHYIVNQYTKSSFAQSDIKKWLSANNIIYIPSDIKGMIDANYSGIPYILKNKKSMVSEGINKVTEAVTNRL